jgi:hypothetical protein
MSLDELHGLGVIARLLESAPQSQSLGDRVGCADSFFTTIARERSPQDKSIRS